MTEPPRHPETGDDDAGVRPDRESTGIPHWVKVVGIIVAIVVLLVVVLMLTGVFSDGHRPGPPPGGH
jgi:hypothetical protein